MCAGWVISSEIQPLETRSLGQGVTVFVSLINGAIIGQTFLSMLCSLKYGVYLLFAGMQLLATLFFIFLLPETTGIPIELVKDVSTAGCEGVRRNLVQRSLDAAGLGTGMPLPQVFKIHPFWKRFNVEAEDPAQKELLALLEQRKAAAPTGSGKKLLNFGKLRSPRKEILASPESTAGDQHDTDEQ